MIYECATAQTHFFKTYCQQGDHAHERVTMHGCMYIKVIRVWGSPACCSVSPTTRTLRATSAPSALSNQISEFQCLICLSYYSISPQQVWLRIMHSSCQILPFIIFPFNVVVQSSCTY